MMLYPASLATFSMAARTVDIKWLFIRGMIPNSVRFLFPEITGKGVKTVTHFLCLVRNPFLRVLIDCLMIL